MIVYVESNFVLELALGQEESASCTQILDLCRTRKATLVVPAFSLAEPFQTAMRRHKERKDLQVQLEKELKQLLRTQSYQSQAQASQDIMAMLFRSMVEEQSRLTTAVQEIVTVAETIPLTDELIRAGLSYQNEGDFTFPDGVVFASIVSHLRANKPLESCFLNKNRKDFSSPERVAELKALGCRLIYAFQAGLQFLESQRA